MNITTLANRTEKAIRHNSPTILTSLGVSGVLTTAYLAGKASYEIGQRNKGVDAKTFIKKYWRVYIPAAISGTLTIACIITGAKIGTKRTAAAYSLLAVSERAFSEYKDKVVETIGKKKEQAVRDEIAQDRVSKNPTGTVIFGDGTVRCFDAHSGRYFNSDMETLRKAQNDINALLHREDTASLSDFYHMVGLPNTTHSSSVGWESDKMMELEFSTVLSENGIPCISFDFNYIKGF